MLYYWLKYVMRVVVRVYYRERYFIGFDQVPAKGPVIFACNHPNSFLDAMIVGCMIDRPVHFLTRSDVFNSPLKLWILSRFRMIPIYRLQEGAENLDKNKDTFDKCQKIFKAGGAVLIFSEGLCIQELRLRPLKKGTARIALDYSKDGSPLTIIPTGLNYLKATEFRKTLLVRMEKPFNAADFAAEYQENNSRGINSFNKRLESGLRDVVIDIQDKPAEKEIAQLLYIRQNDAPGNLVAMIQLVKRLNRESKEGNSRYAELVSALRNYRTTLEKQSIDDDVVVRPPAALPPGGVFAALAHYPGRWLFLPPTMLVTFIARSKVKRVEFYDSVLLGGSAILFFFYFVLIFAGITLAFGAWIGLAVVAGLWLAGELSIVGYDAMQANRRRQPDERERLLQMRREINRLTESVFDLVKSH